MGENENTHFMRQGLHSFPFESGEDVLDEERVDVGFDLLEFCFARVEREGGGGGLACLARAGQEVEGEEFHLIGCRGLSQVRNAHDLTGKAGDGQGTLCERHLDVKSDLRCADWTSRAIHN
jgi:hypothetical protein